MTEEEIQQRIQAGRAFLHPDQDIPEDYKTDQELKRPQPPLTKEPMRPASIPLPTDFSQLSIENDFLKVINTRSSHRVYAGAQMSLLSLSFLLWCCQGIKGIRGKSYATLRTVPCGGARHEFECYLAVQNVETLADGLYHYLPRTHALELLSSPAHLSSLISSSLENQVWAAKANVVFYFSYVCRRAEWRYGIGAARMIMADVGHISENLYLALTALGLGGCAVGAVSGALCDRLFELDGQEEFTLYAFPAGTIRPQDQERENDIYAFVKEQGL
jgi:SagB-type dehydrogenase family enzyme